MDLAWDPTRQRAWRAGFGTDTIDPLDEDMRDANLLSLTDATGASLWHPRGLDDFDAIPERTLTLWLDMRDGLASRTEPWVWWHPKGIPTSHQYPASPLGTPSGPSRCGHGPTTADEWVRDPSPPLCGACSALAGKEARPDGAWGQVGEPVSEVA